MLGMEPLRDAPAIELSGSELTIPQVVDVARRNRRVQLSQAPEVRSKMLASRQLLEEKLQRGEIIYGVNTGLGGNVRFILPAQDLANQAGAETDPQKRATLYQQMLQLLVDEGPYVELVQGKAPVVTRTNVQGWIYFPIGDARLYGVSKS